MAAMLLDTTILKGFVRRREARHDGAGRMTLSQDFQNTGLKDRAFKGLLSRPRTSRSMLYRNSTARLLHQDHLSGSSGRAARDRHVPDLVIGFRGRKCLLATATGRVACEEDRMG